MAKRRRCKAGHQHDPHEWFNGSQRQGSHLVRDGRWARNISWTPSKIHSVYWCPGVKKEAKSE